MTQLNLPILETNPPMSESIDLVGAMLEAYRGDYRSAIADLMADADFLREQLYTASSLMSQGMVRGWRPKYERV